MLDLTRHVDDVGFAYRVSQFMQYIDSLSALVDLRSNFPDDFAGSSSIGTYQWHRSSLNPGAITLRNSSGVLIMIAGANNYSLMRDTLDSYALPVDGNVNSGVNPYFWRIANDLKNDLVAAGFDLTGPVRIVGHSLGGAIAAVLGDILYAAGTNNNVEVLTFGAPRMGVSSYCDRLETFKLERWFNDTDPISIVPFHADESPMAYTVTTWTIRRAWTSYTNPRPGRSIDSNGLITGAFGPPGDLGPNEASLLNWLIMGIRNEPTVHGIAEYCRRLRTASLAVTPAVTLRARAVANETPAIPLPPIAVMPPRYVPMPTPQIERVITATRPTISPVVQAADSNQVPVKPIVRFRAVKVSGEWCVMHSSSVVAIAANKRDARSKARRWNASIRADSPTAPENPVAVDAIIEDVFEV